MTNDEKRIIELEQEVKMLRSVLGMVEAFRREANSNGHTRPTKGPPFTNGAIDKAGYTKAAEWAGN